ncbi:MAG: biotin--[acetyl-CoA-carboxylase] ligase, partial [Spirochaetaceae bacterium]|nr:biotin--[acetyl-CoA-carboxylase] ligase [Spirochaetaceae bacterium]
MEKMNINNPFYEAPVYYRDVTGSTMEDSKKDASRGIFHGTVYRTSYQESGRGRIRGRNWLSTKAQNLMFTLVLKRSKLDFELNYLPLIAGAALTSAVRDYCGKIFYLKWPNDLIYNGKKCAGILCEADSEYFYCGIGVNCNQIEFPTEISHKTISLKSIVNSDIDLDNLNTLILRKFKYFLEKGDEWRNSVESFLYK